MNVPRNPVIARLGAYPLERHSDARADVVARGVELVDFGLGEPAEDTPPFVRDALVAALDRHRVAAYPAPDGLPELREAIAGWAARRFGARLDPDTEVVPTLGSKDAAFHLANVLVDREGGRDTVAVTTPGYPVYARGAAFAGARLAELALEPGTGDLPGAEALDALPWDRMALLWVNAPHNPTAATLSLERFADMAGRCRRHGVVLASDEAYNELWFGPDAPVSALQLEDRTNVLVLNTLSKRSAMPGYHSGFLAGDPDLVASLKHYRPSVGVAPQTFIQHASAVAWSDDEHVAAARERYRAKRDVVLPALVAGDRSDLMAEVMGAALAWDEVGQALGAQPGVDEVGAAQRHRSAAEQTRQEAPAEQEEAEDGRGDRDEGPRHPGAEGTAFVPRLVGGRDRDHLRAGRTGAFGRVVAAVVGDDDDPGNGGAEPVTVADRQHGVARRHEQGPHLAVDLGRGPTPQPQRRGDVVVHRHRRVVDELLVDHGHVALAHRQAGHVLAVHAHPAGAGRVQAGHDAHQTGLAGLGGAQQHRHGTGLRGQVHLVQPGRGPDPLADAFQLQLHGFTFMSVPSFSGWGCDCSQSLTRWRSSGV